MKSLPKSSMTDSLVGKLLQRVPGGSFAQEQLERMEARLLQELKARLDAMERSPAVAVLALSVTQKGRGKPRAPADLLRDLLEASNDQTRDEALTVYYTRALASLVPDEARILSVLADGRSFPLVSIHAGPRLGMATRPVEEALSTVGRQAAVHCPELVPYYIQRLRTWGLVQIDAEESGRQTDYQMLEADGTVRKLLARIEEGGERARVSRRILRMSEIGRAFWLECRVSRD